MNERMTKPVRRCGGFTLLEMLIGMSLLVMILTALGLSMQGAADASRWGNSKSRSLAAATLTLNRICSDLRQAESVTVDGGRKVTVTLPDGTSHLYVWSGTAGDSLRYMNQKEGILATLVDNVQQFSAQPITEYSPVTGTQTTTRVRVTLDVSHGEATTQLETSVRLRRKIM